MATNYRGTGERVQVKAGAARTSGTAAVDENLAGFPIISAETSQLYPLALEGEWEIPFIASSVKGDRVDITDATSALVRVAYGGEVAAGNRKFATIVAVPGDGETLDATQAPKTGFMWIKLLPQATHTFLGAIVIAQTQHGEATKNEKQTVTLPSGVTGGTFTLTSGGHTTTALPYNATAAEMKTALEELASIGAGNIEVTGAAGGPYTVEWKGAHKEEAVALMTATSSLAP